MAQKNRSDLKAYSRSLIVESQTSEEITPEDHNQVNDEMIDSVLNVIDDLAISADFETPNPLTKKYISPFVALLYLLGKSDKATQAEIVAGLNDSKFITPKGLASFLLKGGFGIEINEVDNPGAIDLLKDATNWEDSYGNQADIGGQYVGTALAGVSQHDYYVDPPTGTGGEVKYKYEILLVSGTLKPIRTLYFQ